MINTLTLLLSFAFFLSAQTFDSNVSLRQEKGLILSRLEQLDVDIPAGQALWKELRTQQFRAEDSTIPSQLLEIKARACWAELQMFRYEKEHALLRKKQILDILLIRDQMRNIKHDSDLLAYHGDSLLISFSTLRDSIKEDIPLFKKQTVEFSQNTNRSTKETDSLILASGDLWLKRELKAVQKTLRSFENFIQSSEHTLAELQSHITTLDTLLNQQAWNSRWEVRGLQLLNIWNYEVHKSEEGSITLGKVILAIFVTLLGVKVARKTAFFLIHIARRNFKLESGTADAGQRLLYYFFAILFVLYALNLVQFPLTAFTVVGGALALGLGFGSQAVMNNFISGLILLIERPVKRGDFVEINQILGTVESIGLRSTLIRTPSNVHLIIPNSSFIETNVTNWTLSDRIIRMEVKIGVAYGSDIQKTKTILEQSTFAIPAILNTPKPVILFAEFGDNALQFEVLFWAKINELIERKKVMSELRYIIEEKLNKENIIISFPQRDIHIDTLKPLEIRIQKE